MDPESLLEAAALEIVAIAQGCDLPLDLGFAGQYLRLEALDRFGRRERGAGLLAGLAVLFAIVGGDVLLAKEIADGRVVARLAGCEAAQREGLADSEVPAPRPGAADGASKDRHGLSHFRPSSKRPSREGAWKKAGGPVMRPPIFKWAPIRTAPPPDRRC